jgi:hypothetical protein
VILQNKGQIHNRNDKKKEAFGMSSHMEVFGLNCACAALALITLGYLDVCACIVVDGDGRRISNRRLATYGAGACLTTLGVIGAASTARRTIRLVK